MISLASPHHVYQPDPNAQQNLLKTATGEPTLVRTVKNAKLYSVGEGEDTIDVVHIYGKAPPTPKGDEFVHEAQAFYVVLLGQHRYASRTAPKEPSPRFREKGKTL